MGQEESPSMVVPLMMRTLILRMEGWEHFPWLMPVGSHCCLCILVIQSRETHVSIVAEQDQTQTVLSFSFVSEKLPG